MSVTYKHLQQNSWCEAWACVTRRCSLFFCSSETNPGYFQSMGRTSSGGLIDAMASLTSNGDHSRPKNVGRAFVADPSRTPLAPFDVAARSALGGATSSSTSPAPSALAAIWSLNPAAAPFGVPAVGRASLPAISASAEMWQGLPPPHQRLTPLAPTRACPECVFVGPRTAGEGFAGWGNHILLFS